MPVPQSFVLRCPNSRCAQARVYSTGFVPLERMNYQRMRYAGSIQIGLLTRLFRSLFNLPDNLPTGTYHLYYCPVCREEALYTNKHGMMRQVYLTENGDLRLLA
jgi:hypothetical protein